MPHVARLTVLVVAAVLAIGVGAPFARASGDVSGRVFTLGGEALTTVRVAPDFTVYAVDDGGRIVRLRPGDHAFSRLTLPLAARRDVADLAVAPDGALWWTEQYTGRVWRRSDGGTAVPVAGIDSTAWPFPDDLAARGDGWPPTAVRLCPDALALTPSGEPVVSDAARAIRVAGTTMRTLWAADATAARVYCDTSGSSVVGDLAVTRDGATYGLLRSGSSLHLWSLDPLHIVPLPGMRALRYLAAAPDGSLLITSFSRLVRWRPGAAKAELVMPLFSSYETEDTFDGDGRTAASFADVMTTSERVVAAPDGGLLLSVSGLTGDDRVVYVAPAHPGRLAVALEPRRSRVAGGRYVAQVRVTRRARVRLTVTGAGKRLVRAVTRDLPAGVSRVAIRLPSRFGGFTVRVTATGEGQWASDDARLFLASVLPVAAVRADVPDSYDRAGCGIRRDLPRDPATAIKADCSSDDTATIPGRCLRRGRRRVDCAYAYDVGDGDLACRVRAERLTRFGTILSDDVEASCPPGRASAAPPSPGPPLVFTESHELTP